MSNETFTLSNIKEKTKKFVKPLILSTAMSVGAPMITDVQSPYLAEFLKPRLGYSAEPFEKENNVLKKELLKNFNWIYSDYYSTIITEDNQYGLGKIATDGYSITHKYDSDLKKWQPLPEYLPFKTANERMGYTLNNLLRYKFRWTEHNIPKIEINPLRLDKDEVKKYLESFDDSDLKSFKILKNAKGEPALILATNSEYGMDDKSVNDIKLTVDRLNKIDPKIIDEITFQNHIRGISGDTPPSVLKQYEMNSGDYFEKGIIRFNTSRFKNKEHLYTVIFLLHSRYLKLLKDIDLGANPPSSFVKDKLNENPMKDRVTWTKNWLDKNKKHFNEKELTEMYNLLTQYYNLK